MAAPTAFPAGSAPAPCRSSVILQVHIVAQQVEPAGDHPIEMLDVVPERGEAGIVPVRVKTYGKRLLAALPTCGFWPFALAAAMASGCTECENLFVRLSLPCEVPDRRQQMLIFATSFNIE